MSDRAMVRICLLIILAGSILAWLVQSSGGSVRVHDLRFASSTGEPLSALLYVPVTATAANPAPGIVAIHGYINSRETQAGFAIEFARRGMVVLALDQTGHGYSPPPAFAAGFGGPDALAYLRSLPFVDPQRIGLEGHSMGGWASLMAASAYPDGYSAMVLEGSSTGTLGTAAGNAEFPRNLGLVFSRYDEFSALMWGSETAPGIIATEKLQTLFATDQPVAIGKTYGAIKAGTARELYMPAVTHPGDHLSVEAIGNAIDWFGKTLGFDSSLGSTEQTWYYKELATLVCLLALAVLTFPLARLALNSPWFSSLKLAQPARQPGGGQVLGLALMVLVPIITYFKFQEWGNVLLPANVFWPQNITTGIMVWALGNALITLVLLAIRYRGLRELLPLLAAESDQSTLSMIRKSAGLAVLINGTLYLVLLLADLCFLIDFRFWVVALKLMSLDHFISFFAYLPGFILYFLILGLALHQQFRWAGGVTRGMYINAAIMTVGFVLLLLVQYIPLFLGMPMTIASQPLLTIVAIQFVPLLAFVAALSTWLFHLTGRVYAGAFTSAIFVTWYVVAGQATHVAR